MNSDFFSEDVFLRCLSFLYTGTVSLTNIKDQVEDTITAAHFLNLPKLVSMCENEKKHEVMSSTSTLTEWNINVIKELFFNKVKMEEGSIN